MCATFIYAGDVVLVSSAASFEDSALKLDCDVLKTPNGALIIVLLLIQVMRINRNRSCKNPPPLNIKIGNTQVEEVKEDKWLGVIMDNILTFKPHVKGLVSKMSHKVNLVARIRKFLCEEMSILLYNPDYAIFLTDFSTKDLSNKVKKESKTTA